MRNLDLRIDETGLNEWVNACLNACGNAWGNACDNAWDNARVNGSDTVCDERPGSQRRHLVALRDPRA